jgi:hypothetical protein
MRRPRRSRPHRPSSPILGRSPIPPLPHCTNVRKIRVANRAYCVGSSVGVRVGSRDGRAVTPLGNGLLKPATMVGS